ncbi:venom metalloproteinase antarease TserMP_A-like [Amblyomma americanum]
MLMINEHISLNLQKTSPFTERFSLVYEKDGIQQVEERSAHSLSGELYKDPDNEAAILISRRDGLRLKGVIKENIIDHDDDAVLQDGAVRHRLSARENPAEKNYHGDDLAYTSEASERFLGRFQERRDIAMSERSFESKGFLKVTVRTSVLMSQEYIVGFKRSNYSAVATVIDYVAVFFASVNNFLEKFDKKTLDLQLSVTSLVLLTKSSETFVQVLPSERTVINGSTLVKLNQFADSRRDLIGKDDIVIYLSKYTISTDQASGPKTPRAAGFASLGGACTRNRSALVQDNPKTFAGVFTTVHETLHLIGVVHEGDAAPRYLENNLGAQDCSGYSTSIMAPVMQHTELKLSHCTQRQVLAYLRSRRGECLRLRNPNRHQNDIKRNLIRAVLVNTSNLCKKMVPDKPNVKYVEKLDEKHNMGTCYIICRWVEGDSAYYQYTKAPDFTPCGKNQHGPLKACLYGKCSEISTHMKTFHKKIKKNL